MISYREFGIEEIEQVKAYWEDFRSFDLLIRYNGKQEEIFFTVSEEELLSADDIHEIVENFKED